MNKQLLTFITKTKMSKGKIHEEGIQWCHKCKKETLHIPKLGLVLNAERLCTVCRCSNKYNKDE